MTATAIPLLDFAETFVAAARWHGVQEKDQLLLHEDLLPALVLAAQSEDARTVVALSAEVSALVKHPDTHYRYSVTLTEGVRLC
jgi:hypothetical protein